MTPKKPTPQTSTTGSPALSRRALLKGSVGAAPALFAVQTRPARAGLDFACQTASAFGSMQASGPGENIQFCTGRTPGYWKQTQHFDAWPAPYVPKSVPGGSPATLFHAVGFGGTQFSGKTLLDVLEMPGNAGGIVALARHISAALLNAAAGLTPVLSVPDVIEIWNSFMSLGYYEPTAGVHWDDEITVTYLKSTMPV